MLAFNSLKGTVRSSAKVRLRFASSAAELKEEEKPASFIEENEHNVDVDPKKFDKSGLHPQHRNMLHEQLPYTNAHSWIHLSEKYQRKMFGRYGAASGVDPRICFETKADIAKRMEFEKVSQSQKLQEMMDIARMQKQQKAEKIVARELDIAKKLEKLEQWKIELNAKIAKKEAEANAAKERKERLVEEVRRHFGFKVDPKDDRFKEMLEQKEKEDKRKLKEAKRKAKEEKTMAKLLEKTSSV